MHKEYITFLKILKSVSKYSFDISLGEREEDELQRPFNISQEEFLEKMYEKRDVEDVVKEHLRTTSDLLCLVGPRGCGKSSIGLQLTHSLSQMITYKSFIVFLDIRMDEVLRALRRKNPESISAFIRKRIKTEYMSRLFPYPRSIPDNPRVQLYAFLLERKEKHIQPTKIFYMFQELQDEAAELISAYEDGDPESRRNITYYDWLMLTHRKEADVKSLIRKLNDLIEISHLVYAARYIWGYARHVIWLDNIDALPGPLQLEAVEALKGFLGTMTSYASCVISVREENVFREDNFEDAGGPPYDTRIVMEMPRNGAGHAVYPSCDVPVVKINTMRNIVEKRISFTKSYQSKMINRYRSEITKLRRKLKIAKSRKDKTIIKNAILEKQVELSDYLPGISDIRYDHLRNISEKILETIDSEKAIYVANNSIRDLLFIHRDFLGFLLKSPNEEIEPPEALGYENWYLGTLFLTWIRNVKRKYQIVMYDIIEECDGWYKIPQTQIGCLLPHVIITAAWNITLERGSIGGRHLSSVKVGEVVERLSLIGYNRDDILKWMFLLCYQGKKRGNFIEFQVKEDFNDYKQINDDHTFRITYRGKAFTGFVSSSFGYIYECIRHFENPEESFSAHPQIISTRQHARKMLPYLCDIAQMHYKEFKRIVGRGKLGNKAEALNNYYLYFGIPQKNPYKRKINIGVQFQGIRRTLLFQSIISSLLGYVRTGGIQKQLRILENLFIKAMNGVKALEKIDPEYEEINFRRELGLPPRKV